MTRRHLTWRTEVGFFRVTMIFVCLYCGREDRTDLHFFARRRTLDRLAADGANRMGAHIAQDHLHLPQEKPA